MKTRISDLFSQEEIDALKSALTQSPLPPEQEETQRKNEQLAKEREKPLTEKQANALYWIVQHYRETGYMLAGWELGRLIGCGKSQGSRYLKILRNKGYITAHGVDPTLISERIIAKLLLWWIHAKTSYVNLEIYALQARLESIITNPPVEVEIDRTVMKFIVRQLEKEGYVSYNHGNKKIRMNQSRIEKEYEYLKRLGR